MSLNFHAKYFYVNHFFVLDPILGESLFGNEVCDYFFYGEFDVEDGKKTYLGLNFSTVRSFVFDSSMRTCLEIVVVITLSVIVFPIIGIFTVSLFLQPPWIIFEIPLTISV